MEESSIDEVWRFNGDLMFSDCCSGSTRFCILNKRPLQGNALVDGRLSNKTQVTSRPDPSCPEKCKSVSTCAQKKAKQQWDMGEQAAFQKRDIHDMSPDEVEEPDAIILKTRRKLQNPVERSMLYVARIRISTAKTQTQ